MIVKKFSHASNFSRFNRSLRRQPLLEIPHGSANLRVIRKDSHDFSIPVKPHVPRIRRQQHFLLFAKMHVPRFVPEPDKLLRLTLDRRAKEVGLLLATGYAVRQVRRLVLAEGLLLAVVGTALGLFAAVAYNRLLLAVA